MTLWKIIFHTVFNKYKIKDDLMTTKRNCNIEILRFIFCLFIVLVHFQDYIRNGYGTTGYLGVEFFFAVSGIFLGRKLKKDKDQHKNEPLNKTLTASNKYVLSRISSIYPFYFTAVIFFYIAKVIFMNFSIFSGALYCISDFLFLQIFGFPSISYTGTLWFLAALFFSIYILYPIIRRHYDFYIKYMSLPIVLLNTGYIIRTSGDFAPPPFFNGFLLNPGILRAIAMITLGILINEFSDRMKTVKFSKFGHFILTASELVCYLFVFLYMTFITNSFDLRFDFVPVIFICLGLLLTISEQSYFNNKFNNRFSLFLGKSSMILFMTHHYWVSNISLFQKILFEKTGIEITGNVPLIIFGYLLSFLSGVLVYFIGIAVRKAFILFKNTMITAKN